MTGRKCGTCKHFEPGPLWRKGWCRNPLLYSPQQSHLVNDEELDCERGMGNYWEAAEPAFSSRSGNISDGFREPVAEAMGKAVRYPLVSDSGQPVYPVTGAAGQGGDRTPYGDPPGGGWSGGPPNGGDRDYNYDPEERYWTDYLRIAAPILGVILMVLVFWLAISQFLGDDDENGSIAGEDTTPVSLPTTMASPAPATTPPPANGTLPPIIVEGTPGTETTPPAGNGAATTPPDVPPTTGGEIAVGSTVEVIGTGGTGVNVRSQASTDGEIIATFIDGTILEVTGDSVPAEDFIWWPVISEEGIQGYVVQEYLEAVE
ncbi:hypothetical protein BH20CHL1_BH20CHL1_07200 [soil metagenome]|nr:SH3 domain-containing protein [Chloroflexia bacterium]